MPFTFPEITRKEILACMGDLEVPLSDGDLLKPTMEAIRPVYESVVTLLMGISREELHQPVFSAIDALEFPELHEESIACLAFNRAVTKLMYVAGVEDFTLRDLYKPEANRTMRNLAAIINFARFREERLDRYQELQSKSDALLEKKQALEEANMQLAAELKQMEVARAAEEPAVAALEAETQDLVSQIAGLNKHQAQLAAEVRTLKQTATELSDKVANEKFLLLNARQEAVRLKAEIVESPEKLQRTLDELSSSVERERAAVGDAERRARDLQSKLDCVAKVCTENPTKVEREVQKCIGMMQEAEAEITKHKEVSKKVKGVQAKIKVDEDEVWRLAAEHQHLERQAQAAMERLQKFRQQSAGRREAAERKLEAARAQGSVAEVENEATLAKASETQAKSEAMYKSIESDRAEHEREMVAMIAQFDALQTQVHEYHQRLAAVMEEVPPLSI
eukprot:SM000003S11130  [mRNA]  locus=s3:1138193:1140561:+ [translate_table: standard]